MLPLSGHDDVALFNDIANDAESTQNKKNRHNRCFKSVQQWVN